MGTIHGVVAHLCVPIEAIFKHPDHSIVEYSWPDLAALKTATMSHYDILKGVHCCLSDLSSLVGSQTLDPFKQDVPDFLIINNVCFLSH